MVLAGCPKSGRPEAPGTIGWTAAWSFEDAGATGAVGALAIAGDTVIVADGARVRRVTGGRVDWTSELVGDVRASAAAVSADGATIAVALAGTGPFATLPHGLRGDPGAVVVAMDGANAWRWERGFGATEWATVRSIAAAGDGFVVAGAFAGTLRAGDRTVTSAGGSDGFWARVDGAGRVTALHRMGGAGADAIAGAVVLADGGVGLAGTFTGPAALADLDLPGLYTGPHADGFVARTTADGRVAWMRMWGGPLDDACAGVVATSSGLAVAGTVRGTVDVAGRRLDVRGASDGLVAWFDADGAVRNAYLVGGNDLDGLSGLAGAGDRVIAIGWYAGAIDTPDGRVTARGGDDPMLAVAMPGGLVGVRTIAAGGPAAMHAVAADAGGWAFAAGTAPAPGDDAPALLDGVPLPAGNVVRALRW